MSSFVKYISDGSQQLFTVSFPYIARSHVQVRRNGILMLTPGDYEWQSNTQIRLRTVFPVGTLLEFRRVTPDGSLVTFTNGGVLTEQDLNTAVRQALYRNEELEDELSGYVSDAVSRFGFGGETASMTTDELLASVAQSILESELLTTLQEHVSDIGVNAQSIVEQTVRLNDIQTLIDSIAYVDGLAVGTFAANESTARVAGDEALQTQLNLIGAKSGDGLAWILDTDKVKVSSTESLANRLVSLAAEDGSNAAAITSEQTARISADSALASSITGLAATLGTTAAALSTEQTARANGDSALATSIASLASTVDNNNAAIQDVLAAYADGGLASASDVETLQATVDGNTASLQTLQTVVAGTGGLTSQYMVKLDVNGYVSGFGQYNDGSSAYFYVLADKFAVVTPGGGSAVPFAISGGTCYMQNVVINGALIQDATITNASIANLTIGTLKLQDLAVTSAKIASASITSAKIADAAITSAKIGTASIGSAHIQDLSVDTIHIANYAITQLSAVQSTTSFNVTSTGETEVASLAISSSGATTLILLSLDVRMSVPYHYSGTSVATIRLYRDATLVKSLTLDDDGTSATSAYSPKQNITTFIAEVPTAGVHTYSIKAVKAALVTSVTVSNVSLACLEAKK